MQIREKKIGDRLLIALTGRLDGTTAGLLEERFNSLIQLGERHFVLDCSELTYLSSAGLRVLFAATRKLTSPGGRIVFAAVKSHVLDVVHLSGSDGIFPQFATVDAALAN